MQSFLHGTNNLKEHLYDSFEIKPKIKHFVRKKSIQRAKSRIKLAGKSIDELPTHEFEEIVSDEEKELISEYKSNGIKGLLLLFGINVFA